MVSKIFFCVWILILVLCLTSTIRKKQKYDDVFQGYITLMFIGFFGGLACRFLDFYITNWTSAIVFFLLVPSILCNIYWFLTKK